MAAYTLFCFAQSGNAFKVASYLQMSGADWAPRFVDFFGGETRTPEYRRINVMGEVPILEHGDLRLTQTGVILDYLIGQFGRFGWEDDEERREIYRWLFFDNHKLTSYTASLRFLRYSMKSRDTAVLDFLEGRVSHAYRVLDRFGFFFVPQEKLSDSGMRRAVFWINRDGLTIA